MALPITITKLDGENFDVTLDSEGEWYGHGNAPTVKYLKDQIYKIRGIPRVLQELLLDDKILEDDCPLDALTANKKMADSHNEGLLITLNVTLTKVEAKLQACLSDPSKIDVGNGLDGETALHEKAAAGDIPMVQALLYCRASANVRDKSAETPLHWVVRSGHKEVCELLINHKASLESSAGHFSHTPLAMAVLRGNTELCKLLLSRRADPNTLESGGASPLWRASHKGYHDICKLLLGKDADANLAYKGVSPLDTALSQGHACIAELLLEHQDKCIR